MWTFPKRKRDLRHRYTNGENVLDLSIIGAGSRVEHYEMAGYTTAINLAKQLGENEVASLLSESLSEEEAADKKLRSIGQNLLKTAP
jgi:Mn-containing catalase